MHLLTLLLVLLFALVIAYFCYSVYFYGGRWVANPYNPRISSQKQHVIMGTLTDRDGTVLAYTDEDGSRRYNGSAATRKAVCQVVGDSGGKVSTGADTFHAQFLLGFRSSIFERLADAFTGTTQRGDDVRLTISERLSRYISEQFPSGKRGAVVVLNYKTNEILAMVSMPQFDPTDKGYQIIQALLAIGSGGLFGVGLGQGTPEKIPAYYNDFIFAVVCEQLGQVFGVLLLAVYVLLILRGVTVVARARRSFEMLLGCGVLTMLGIQTFMIVAGVIKMIPLTGVTMPFLSYGGSSLLSCMAMIGILHGASARAQENLEEDILCVKG